MAITAAQINETFELILDEVGSPYFTNAQKEEFFTEAQLAIWRKLVQPDTAPGQIAVMGGNAFYESSDKIGRLLAPYTIRGRGLSAVKGRIDNWTNSVVDDAGGGTIAARITTLSGTGGYAVAKEMAFYAPGVSPVAEPNVVDPEDYRPGKWMRKSGEDMRNSMTFFRPSECWFSWFQANGESTIYVLPRDMANQTGSVAFYYKATLIARPKPITISPESGSQFPDELLNLIAYQAAELAAINMRDNEFLSNIRTQISQIGV